MHLTAEPKGTPRPARRGRMGAENGKWSKSYHGKHCASGVSIETWFRGQLVEDQAMYQHMTEHDLSRDLCSLSQLKQKARAAICCHCNWSKATGTQT